MDDKLKLLINKLNLKRKRKKNIDKIEKLQVEVILKNYANNRKKLQSDL